MPTFPFLVFRRVVSLLALSSCVLLPRAAVAQDPQAPEDPAPAAMPQELPPLEEAAPVEPVPGATTPQDPGVDPAAPGPELRGAPEPDDDAELPPPAPPTTLTRARWGAVGSVLALATQLLLLPCVGLCSLPVGYGLAALLIIPASLVAGLAFGLLQGQMMSPQDAGGLLGVGITAAAFSFVPGYGVCIQGMCLGPAACLTVPAVMLLLFPAVAGLGGAAGRAVTHKLGVSPVLRAGARAALISAAVAWPLAGAVALLAGLGGLTWGAGSLVFINSYAAGDATSAEEAERRSAQTARYDQASQWFFLGGSALAALGGVLVLGGAVLLLPTVLLPLLEALGDARDARGELQ